MYTNVDERAFADYEIARDLQVLRGRIDVMSGRGVKMPTIEETQRAAGVKTQERPLKHGQRRKPGYKPKL